MENVGTSLSSNILLKGMLMQRQWREIGKSTWLDCEENWFNYCNTSPLHDTRSIPSKENIMKDEVLGYIRTQVEYWPVGADNVRLDKDGEICFIGNTESSADFTPIDKFRGLYVPEIEHGSTGVKYTFFQWVV